MYGQAHLARRGNTYQWRRRICRQSTKIVDLKLSLGTTDLRVATIIARRTSAESDTIVDEIMEDSITPDEARAWLAEVIRRERAKIETLQMLRRFDASDPNNDARHDAATQQAWAHVARAGLQAQASAEMDTLVASQLDLIRRDLTSDARRRIVAQEFQELTGRDNLSGMGLVKLMSLLISGKRAAWAAGEAALTPLDDLADTLAQQTPSALLGEAAQTAPSASPAPKPEPTLDPAITAVVARMVAMKREEGVEPKTLRQYQSFAELFTLLTGLTDIRGIRQPDATAFRAALAKIPKSWGKSPADRRATREEVLARAATLPRDKVGLSTGTINRHLEHLGQAVAWAADEGIAVDARLNPSKLRRKETTRANAKRDAFTLPQLERLFQSPVWTGSESEYFQTRPGRTIYRNGTFWCPLIGALTGARREEIAGLAPSDIIEVDGIPCFSIEDSDLRRVKNLSSKRVVPIHSRLIEMGFLDHAAQMRKTAQPDLFPDLREPKSGQHGRKLGRRMRQIVDDALGAEGAGLSFHSLRHYVQNALEQAGIEDKITRDIIGHEGRDIHEKVYHKPTPPRIMRAAIEALPAPF